MNEGKGWVIYADVYGFSEMIKEDSHSTLENLRNAHNGM